MQCPICAVDLQMTERQGVEIDYCPKCRGVWLDRGELDKIVERSSGAGFVSDAGHPAGAQRTEHYGEDNLAHGGQGYAFGKKHKREGFLGELFDF